MRLLINITASVVYPPLDDSCPSTTMASLSEEVLLVLKKVRQRKQDGTLYLMAERIAWGPEGKDRFTVSHLYSDIRCEYQRGQVSFMFDTSVIFYIRHGRGTAH